MRRTVIKTPIHAGSRWKAKPLARGEKRARDCLADRFPGTAAGISLNLVSRLTGVPNLRLFMGRIDRIDSEGGEANARGGANPILVAISATLNCMF